VDKRTIAIHLCKNGFVPGYKVWTFHGESGTRVVVEDEHDCDVGNVDRMDEMLEAIQANVTGEPPTMEVEVFFKLLKAMKELLHEHTKVTLIAFITRVVANEFLNNLFNSSRGGSTNGDPWYNSGGGGSTGDDPWYY
jgi:hypothetical protein